MSFQRTAYAQVIKILHIGFLLMAKGFVSKAQSNKEKETREKETINPDTVVDSISF